ncbi:protein-glutamine glutaminase family protein [Spartinivicinus poritis]|uniref:Protein-glutamine glutaminase family protein n=1 Tax=Spartinivicinus poritis TaxID=2994640 RepID=A0ABT5UDR6_9GAMM|nr:protein-glutamine glutaminase family protein [Spartinivicinus sp. A2-2]MDE1463618.1 protein-glutamine glutaminase family protein [Spartinivicinus sp. A2-2]
MIVNKAILILLLTSTWIQCWAIDVNSELTGISATRNKGESYESAALKYEMLYLNLKQTKKRNKRGIEYTPKNIATSITNIDFSEIPKWDSYSNLNNAFMSGRDSQFITDENNVKRRLPWLYPQDGCFVRAALLSRILTDNNYQDTKKLFVFGKLKATTINAPDGSVSWWYHVAVVASVQDTVYVFDPSIDPSAPIKLNKWIKNLTNPVDELKFSLCDKNTYHPFSSCNNPTKISKNILLSDINYYLNLEKSNLIDLKRNIKQELADNPPWRNKIIYLADESSPKTVGGTYVKYNHYSNKVEYFILNNFNDEQVINDIPTHQNNNSHWTYIGTSFNENYVQKIMSWSEDGYVLGSVFKHNPPNYKKTVYFRLINLDTDGSYGDFPTNNQDNRYWEYLEEDYPSLLKLK